MLRLSSGVLVATAGLWLANLPTATMAPLTCAGPTPEVQLQAPNTTQRAAAAKTVQISLNVDAEVLIEDSDGKRIGFDFNRRKFVNEIPNARAITQESSATYVLPFDKSGRPYKVTIVGKSAAKVDVDLSMTGPGFVVGFRSVPLTSSQVQTMSIAANGLGLSLTANQDGPTPQLFLTEQSGRDKPSYRFEVSSLLAAGRTITVNLDIDKTRLYFKTDGAKKDSFSVKTRRTNPGGTRNLYAHQDISFGRLNSYAMDFGEWDGKSEMCFYEVCDVCDLKRCTKLGNEADVK
jgi:hypothetical protein